MSATAKVFSITELTEAILLEVPPRDVLLHQRVCRKWQAVIKTSKPLQEALFFKPITTTKPVHYEPGPDHWATSQDPKRTLVFESPLLTSSMSDHPEMYGSALPEASWRHQLITQPPLEQCEVIHHTLTHHEITPVIASAAAGGVAMGDITGQLEASEWYRGGLTVNGWRSWRSCLDAWTRMPAREFLEFLLRSMEEER